MFKFYYLISRFTEHREGLNKMQVRRVHWNVEGWKLQE